MPVKKPLLGAAAEDHPAGSQELPVAQEHQPVERRDAGRLGTLSISLTKIRSRERTREVHREVAVGIGISEGFKHFECFLLSPLRAGLHAGLNALPTISLVLRAKLLVRQLVNDRLSGMPQFRHAAVAVLFGQLQIR